MKLPVSIFIVTLNEEKNIGRLLESVKSFDEIIVVDSGSTDKTIEIAKGYGAKVYHQDWLGYSGQKQHALSLCTLDWVLNLDADEEISTELFIEIGLVIEQENVNAVRFARNDIFIDEIPPTLLKGPSSLRLYRRRLAHFDTSKKVHESATVAGIEIFVSETLNHYGYNEVDTLIAKHNTYSTLKAKEKFAGGKRASLFKLVIIFPLEFLRKYLFQRYFSFGRRGFILSMLSANYAFAKEAKLLECQLKKVDSE